MNNLKVKAKKKHKRQKSKMMEAVPCNLQIPNKYKCQDDGVRYDKDVERFADSERNKKVAFIKSTETFQYVVPGKEKPVTAKGITKIIKAAYFDNYRPVTTNKNNKNANGRPSSSNLRNKYKRKKQRQLDKGKTAQQILQDRVKCKRIKGFTLGTVVHEELCDWARMKSKTTWKRKHPNPNTYTVKVIRALNMMKLEPLFGEWPIYDEHIPYATSIDMVCASGTEKGRLVLVELKTGYQGYFNKGSDMMTRTPLKRVPNSPLNQAYLQCLMAKATLESLYGLNKVYGLVIRVHERGVKAYPIPDEFLRRQSSIYSGVRNYMIETYPKYRQTPSTKTFINSSSPLSSSTTISTKRSLRMVRQQPRQRTIPTRKRNTSSVQYYNNNNNKRQAKQTKRKRK